MNINKFKILYYKFRFIIIAFFLKKNLLIVFFNIFSFFLILKFNNKLLFDKK